MNATQRSKSEVEGLVATGLLNSGGVAMTAESIAIDENNDGFAQEAVTRIRNARDAESAEMEFLKAVAALRLATAILAEFRPASDRKSIH